MIIEGQKCNLTKQNSILISSLSCNIIPIIIPLIVFKIPKFFLQTIVSLAGERWPPPSAYQIASTTRASSPPAGRRTWGSTGGRSPTLSSSGVGQERWTESLAGKCTWGATRSRGRRRSLREPRSASEKLGRGGGRRRSPPSPGGKAGVWPPSRAPPCSPSSAGCFVASLNLTVAAINDSCEIRFVVTLMLFSVLL